jgi:hypothetical protein
MTERLMTDDEGRRAEAWFHLRARLSHGPMLGIPMPAHCAAPVLVGIDYADNDRGGFSPEIQIGGLPSACFERCQATDCVEWGCAKGHGNPPRDMVKHPPPGAGAPAPALD